MILPLAEPVGNVLSLSQLQTVSCISVVFVSVLRKEQGRRVHVNVCGVWKYT